MKPFYFLIAVASAMLLQAVSGYAHPPPGDIIQEEEVVATHNAPTVGSDSLVVQLDLEYWFLAPVIKVPVTPVEGVVEFTYELRSASVDSIYNLVGYVGPPGRMYHHTKWDVVLALGSRNLSFFPAQTTNQVVDSSVGGVPANADTMTLAFFVGLEHQMDLEILVNGRMTHQYFIGDRQGIATAVERIPYSSIKKYFSERRIHSERIIAPNPEIPVIDSFSFPALVWKE